MPTNRHRSDALHATRPSAANPGRADPDIDREEPDSLSTVPDFDRVSSLVQQAVDEFDAPGVTVAGLLRRCQRIASFRGDGIALAWLRLEATAITNEFKGRRTPSRHLWLRA